MSVPIAALFALLGFLIALDLLAPLLSMRIAFGLTSGVLLCFAYLLLGQGAPPTATPVGLVDFAARGSVCG